jgi:hypothetical protein
MYGRQLDVAFVKENGEALVVVNHLNFPNTYQCRGTFERFSGTECDKLTLYIYNLSAAIRGDLALGGYTTIVVRWGYADEGEILGDLFLGNIQRLIYQKVDEVTTQVVIYVYDTGEFKATSFFSGTYANGINFYQIAEEIGRQGKEEGNIETIQLSEKLKDYAVYGSKSMFGPSDEMLNEVAEESGLVYQKANNSLLILSPDEIVNQSEITVFSVYDEETGRVESRSGMIGIPKLTDTGLELECLINTKIMVYSLIQINNSVVSIEQEGAIPTAEYGAALDPDGIYVVTQISGEFNNTGDEAKMNISAVARSVFVDMYNSESDVENQTV